MERKSFKRKIADKDVEALVAIEPQKSKREDGALLNREEETKTTLNYKNIEVTEVRQQILKHKPDYRGLKEPARTDSRLAYVLTSQDLPMNMTQRAIAAILVNYMRGKEGKVFLVLQDIYPKSIVSAGARGNALSLLEKLGLIRKISLCKNGSEIEMLF